MSGPVQAVVVLGKMSCGDWVQVRKARDVNSTAFEFWVLGYLSGSAVQTNEDVLRHLGSNAVETWIDNYCAKNPLDSLGTAADELFEELKARRR